MLGTSAGTEAISPPRHFNAEVIRMGPAGVCASMFYVIGRNVDRRMLDGCRSGRRAFCDPCHVPSLAI